MSCNNGMAFFPSNFMLQNPHEDDQDRHTNPLNPLLPSCSIPQDFHGVAPFLGKRSMSFPGNGNNVEGCCELDGSNINGEEELSDDGSQAGEKKRRLNMEQVKTLEKNFELGNKLEPERKMQLARALGLQPRQIAIWFQNRRARWKTKQLEKDYDSLKRQFEAIKAENDALRARNLKLQEEILALKRRDQTESINLNKDTEGSCSNKSDNSSEIKLEISGAPAAIDSPLPTSSRPFFPQSSSASMRPTQHFFQNPTTGNKIDQIVKDESLTNMFCGIDDQSGFWPWLEHQQFH